MASVPSRQRLRKRWTTRPSGVEILIVSIPRQGLDLQQVKSFGIEPERKAVVALRSMRHFHAAFDPLAGEVMVCDSGALCTVQYDRLTWRNVPRPIFPLDDFGEARSRESMLSNPMERDRRSGMSRFTHIKGTA